MTCLGKYKRDNPKLVMNPYGVPAGCPHEYGYLERPEWCAGCPGTVACLECWNRKIPEKKPEVLYRCDRRACFTCRFPDCQHTSDISHAVDFHKDEHGTYVED